MGEAGHSTPEDVDQAALKVVYESNRLITTLQTKGKESGEPVVLEICEAMAYHASSMGTLGHVILRRQAQQEAYTLTTADIILEKLDRQQVQLDAMAAQLAAEARPWWRRWFS